jgi:hypothetical protein
MTQKLEEFRIFPIIAWVLIIGFAGFVFSLTHRLSDAAGISGELQSYNAATMEYLTSNSAPHDK